MDGRSPELCSECGFDSRAWRVRDAVSLFGALGDWWRLAVAGTDAETLNRRPSPSVWSPLEYGVHSALVTAFLRVGIGKILSTDGVDLPVPPDIPEAADGDEPAVLESNRVVADLQREGRALARLANTADREAWAHIGHLPDRHVSAEAALLHAAHDASHHLMDVGRVLAAMGAGTPAHVGSVLHVNASGGGVPKQPVLSGEIDHRGLVGDCQADRKHHGRPFQALCLWSSEVIAELSAAGHPIQAGSAGENLTLAGVDWAALRPGARLRVGTALTELSFPATPCAKQSRWFSDGDFGRIDHDRSPHWTRWYAWVREPGEVREGDPVVVQPR